MLKTFDEAGVSRIPLFRETLDDPRGMIHIKDLFRWLMAEATGQPLEDRKVAKRKPKFRPSVIVDLQQPRSQPADHDGENPPPDSLRAAVDAGGRFADPHAVDAHPHGARRR